VRLIVKYRRFTLCIDYPNFYGLLRAAPLLVFAVASALAQRSSGPAKGILVVDGGGTSKLVVDEFVRLTGGPKAKIVVIPTGASSLRFGEERRRYSIWIGLGAVPNGLSMRSICGDCSA
jgi:hypothetical protein